MDSPARTSVPPLAVLLPRANYIATLRDGISARPDEPCPICLDQENMQSMVAPHGAHFFHRFCFLRWIVVEGQDTCPMCRQEIFDSYPWWAVAGTLDQMFAYLSSPAYVQEVFPHDVRGSAEGLTPNGYQEVLDNIVIPTSMRRYRDSGIILHPLLSESALIWYFSTQFRIKGWERFPLSDRLELARRQASLYHDAVSEHANIPEIMQLLRRKDICRTTMTIALASALSTLIPYSKFTVTLKDISGREYTRQYDFNEPVRIRFAVAGVRALEMRTNEERSKLYLTELVPGTLMHIESYHHSWSFKECRIVSSDRDVISLNFRFEAWKSFGEIPVILVCVLLIMALIFVAYYICAVAGIYLVLLVLGLQ